jgi:hypothetical protein
MSNIPAEVEVSKLSTEKIIELIRQTRNTLIEFYQEDEAIRAFFSEHFGLEKVSAIKNEFLKRDLKELWSAPVDLVHYAALIKEIKDSGNVAIINLAQHQQLFVQEINILFKKYTY